MDPTPVSVSKAAIDAVVKQVANKAYVADQKDRKLIELQLDLTQCRRLLKDAAERASEERLAHLEQLAAGARQLRVLWMCLWFVAAVNCTAAAIAVIWGK